MVVVVVVAAAYIYICVASYILVGVSYTREYRDFCYNCLLFQNEVNKTTQILLPPPCV